MRSLRDCVDRPRTWEGARSGTRTPDGPIPVGVPQQGRWEAKTRNTRANRASGRRHESRLDPEGRRRPRWRLGPRRHQCRCRHGTSWMMGIVGASRGCGVVSVMWWKCSSRKRSLLRRNLNHGDLRHGCSGFKLGLTTPDALTHVGGPTGVESRSIVRIGPSEVASPPSTRPVAEASPT